MNNLLDFMTSRAGKIWLVVAVFAGLIITLINAIHDQLIPRTDIPYLYGIAWTQWIGVAVFSFLFAVIMIRRVKSNKEQ